MRRLWIASVKQFLSATINFIQIESVVLYWWFQFLCQNYITCHKVKFNTLRHSRSTETVNISYSLPRSYIGQSWASCGQVVMETDLGISVVLLISSIRDPWPILNHFKTCRLAPLHCSLVLRKGSEPMDIRKVK